MAYPLDDCLGDHVLAIPAPELGTLQVAGSDRISWLNGLVTCDLASLQIGQGAYGLATSKVGRIVSDLVVVVGSDRLLLGCLRTRREDLQESFTTYLVMEDAELTNESSRWNWFLMHGARAASVASSLADSLEGYAAPLDQTGLGGAALVIDTQRGEQALAMLRDEGVHMGTEHDWSVLRLERGVPQFGVDFDQKTYPQEASLEQRAVSFQKGCYLGQEVVCRLQMRGHVHRKLVSLVFKGGEAPGVGTAVTTAHGEVVGSITSAVVSPTLGKPVAFAMLKHAHAQVGNTLRAAEQEARVVVVPVGE